MVYVRLIFGFAFILVAVIHSAHSQTNSLTLYNISEQNGLADNRVTCVLQDHAGFMWIGTEDGLSRYDGSAFKIYKKSNNAGNEIVDNFVHSLAEDSLNQIWVGTFNGLSSIDLVTGTTKNYACDLEIKDINFIMKVLPDKNGNVWLGTLGGLVKFIPAQNKFEYHKIPSTLSADNRITDLIIDHRGNFWIATYNDIWQYDLNRKRFKRPAFEIFKKTEGLVNTMMEEHAGRIWLGYWSSGLKWFDPNTGQSSGMISGLTTNIQGIAEVKNRNGHFDIWLNNFSRIDSSRHVDLFSSNAKTLLGSHHVSKLYTSNDGLLWATTNKGVLIMDPLKQFFHHFFISKNELSHQGIALSEKDELLYLGAVAENFLVLYDRTFHPMKSYPVNGNPKFLPNSAVLFITREDQNHVWLGTESGLILLNESNGDQQLFNLSEKESRVATRNFINAIFIDSHNIHWVFPWRSGIWQLDLTTKTFKKIYEGFNSNNEEKKAVMADAVEDDNGNIWFAELDQGLIFYDRKTEKFSKLKKDISKTAYNLSHLVYESPYVWGVTQGKIFRINYQNQQPETWTIPPDLNRSPTGFCMDHHNNVWITTRKGLLSFNKQTHEFKQFTHNDGLLDDLLDGTIYCRKDGKIIYADENYVTVFDPSELIKASKIPEVKIIQARSKNLPIEITRDKNGKKIIDLDYTYNNFIFEWAVLNFSNPFQNKYFCQLEGVDNEWKYVGNSGQAQYASLLPNQYIFRVRGATSDGAMNTTGDLVIITIHPPFWKTWWFFALCGVAFLSLTYAWYRYRLNEALKTERLRNKISTDLHDEIGSTLSSISIMSDLVLQKTQEAKTLEVAHEIRENAVVLMERMDDIVWSINPRNDSIENLLLRVQRFAAHLFEAKSINYQIEIDPMIKQIKLPMEFRQNIYLIVKETINNLVKHSKCKNATIKVTQDASKLNLVLEDDGIGFDLNGINYGNGLASMASRAASMNLKLEIVSAPEKGTSVKLKIKIK